VHNFTLQLEGEGESLVEAQVVQAHVGMSLWTVFHEIYDLKLEGRLRTEMLIVRLPVDEDWDPFEFEPRTSQRSIRLFAFPDSEPAGTFRRARDRSVHILTSHNGQHVLTENLNPLWSDDPLITYGIAPDRAITAIRKAEFDHILDRSRAVLTSPPGSEFRAPSGRRVRSFVRVGNIQYDRDAIDAVFFWMLPHLIGVGAVLTDTWSISSIAFNIAKLSASYFGGAQRCVEMLPMYNDGSEEARAQTRRVVERLDADYGAAPSDLDIMLCLISATHTGSLGSHLQQIFASSSVHLKPRFVALFALGPTPHPNLHDLQTDPRFAPPQEQVAHASEPVAVDPQVYFPLSFKDTVIEINKAMADRSRPFFDRYVGQELIEVHRTHEEGTGRPRHHAIHLATERLMGVPEFVRLLEAEFSKLPSVPTVIVSPPHQPGRALAEHAQAYFANMGHHCQLYAHPNLYFQDGRLTDEEEALRRFLKSACQDAALLVLDDVCITGVRLSQYQRYIRTEKYRGRIDYLVGVARPSHPKVWTDLQRYLAPRSGGTPHTVRCVDFVLLPDWRDENCPWCVEKRLYDHWIPTNQVPEFLVNRLERLSSASASGLRSELFVEIPELPPLKLGPESFFTSIHANQAEVFAAVAAALQWLRSLSSADRPPLGPRRFPVSTVLNHTDYLCSKWTDSILRATFLRAASVEELTYADPNMENERTRTVADLLTQSAKGEHDIALEILLASNLGKCRVKATDDLVTMLNGFGAGKVSSYMLERLVATEPRL
jgi:hypothetical protein